MAFLERISMGLYLMILGRLEEGRRMLAVAEAWVGVGAQATTGVICPCVAPKARLPVSSISGFGSVRFGDLTAPHGHYRFGERLERL